MPRLHFVPRPRRVEDVSIRGLRSVSLSAYAAKDVEWNVDQVRHALVTIAAVERAIPAALAQRKSECHGGGLVPLSA